MPVRIGLNLKDENYFAKDENYFAQQYCLRVRIRAQGGLRRGSVANWRRRGALELNLRARPVLAHQDDIIIAWCR
jgi:hypothetical protein